MDISKYFKRNKNANIKYQILCGIGKVLRQKCIVLNAYTRKEEKFKISTLSFQLKKLEKKCKINQSK